MYLLPSRLYCRFRNLTGSCAQALADFTAGREINPALKILFSSFIIVALMQLFVKG